jgi:transcriptional regulator with GAF, ATPase, and Fis domain
MTADLEMAQMFAELAQALDLQDSVTDALEETVRLAVEALDGCEMAGISWFVQGKRIETLAFTDDLIAECDALQYELGEGPCIDSSLEANTVLISDMSVEARWPKFAGAASERGIASMLSCALASPRRTLGGLNLYAREPKAFDEQSSDIVEIYAAHASIVLASRQLETDLRSAVDTRGMIGQAIGILVERHKIQPKQAFDLLVKASQKRHMKLRDLASYVIETGVDPSTS